MSTGDVTGDINCHVTGDMMSIPGLVLRGRDAQKHPPAREPIGTTYD
jgi:hypothetical protein